jgi:excinuclease ABC subunit C
VNQTVLEDKIRALPDEPGVYLFKDESAKVIYVGKAASLRHRVRSYFQSARNLTARIVSMVSQIRDVEYIVTSSEVEALILESNLIKKHRPRYNVRLKDDKHYPYLRVTLESVWPRVVVARSIRDDGSRYFGPYTRTGAVSETLQLIKRIFTLRTCSDTVLKNVSRPCLNYHIERCSAPCKALVSHDEYMAQVQDVCTFLEGKPDLLLKRLKAKMEASAEALEFEKAAGFRDQIKAIEQITEKQRMISDKTKDRDVVGVVTHQADAFVQVLQVRAGKMIGAEQMNLTGVENRSLAEIVGAFLSLYYSRVVFVPAEILVPAIPEERELLEQWLTRLKSSRVRLRCPKRGDARALLEMATRNAELSLEEAKPRAERETQMAQIGVEELGDLLGIRPPHRIECYDISNIQGRNPVGSMVVFTDGMPDKQEYRRFKIKRVEGQNDYAMMSEVLERRLSRLSRGSRDMPESSFDKTPDLLLVDGGKPQLGAALSVLREQNLTLPLIALAKREEEIFVPGRSDPLFAAAHPNAVFLLQRIRDEAHRFAVGYHRKLRTSESRHSVLDEIPGIGPRRRTALLKRFGSIKAIAHASLEELQSVPGMNRASALRVQEHLSPGK